MYRSTGHIAWNICVSSRLGKVWLGAMSSSAEVAVGSVGSLLSLQAWSRLSWSSSISMTISLGYCKTFFKSLCNYYHCRITSKTRASPASGYVGYGQNSKEDKISIPSLKVVKWKNKSIPVPCKSKRRSWSDSQCLTKSLERMQPRCERVVRCTKNKQGRTSLLTPLLLGWCSGIGEFWVSAYIVIRWPEI